MLRRLNIMSALITVKLLWIWISSTGCFMKSTAEEVELFNSVKETRLKWTSKRSQDWAVINLALNSTTVPAYQACLDHGGSKTLFSHWFNRKDTHYPLMDVGFAQEEETPGQLSPFQIDLFESDNPLTRFNNGQRVLELQAATPFLRSFTLDQIQNYISKHSSLTLGHITGSGFHLGFSYAGPCVFLVSVRLYYRRCPKVVSDLVVFDGAAAGSGPRVGSCVPGAVEGSQPIRECQLDGIWSALQGHCVCGPGHQLVDTTCQACRTGYYKPANGSEGCDLCPPNSRTDRDGAETCECLQGYSRLPSDPALLGCTKAPSAPVNMSVHRHSDSMFGLTWEPPHDLGGREEVLYDLQCSEKKGEPESLWVDCGEAVVFVPDSANLTMSEVNVTGLKPDSDYRLSVRARNAISSHQKASSSSVATVNIHAWTISVIVTVSTAPNTSAPNTTLPRVKVAEEEPRIPTWLIVGGLLGGLLILVLIPAAVFTRCCNDTKLIPEQEVELLPINPGRPNRRPEDPEQVPQQANMVQGVAQLLEGFSERMLTSLKDVLVEREQLTLGKELGKGEFGSVVEGIFTPEEGLDIRVAVKTIKVGIHSQGDLHEFLREAEIMKNFHHDNVVKLLGVTLDRQQDSPQAVPLVILPFMTHRDLRRFLVATRYGDIQMYVPLQSLMRFMIDIAAGMDYLSSQGFLHRDLAARNCMLGDDLRVCVADFGLSKKVYSSNYYRQKVAVRMPIKWMSIESLSESIFTTKSDVWSFGVTMWEIVSRGRTPYPGVQNHELLDLLMSGHRLKQQKDCDWKLFHLMQNCWLREPSRRPSFGELGAALKGLLAELPPLEASEEACYINQGLEVAACHGPTYGYEDPEMEGPAGAVGNVYLPNPMGDTPAARGREEDNMDNDKGGYLLF